MSTEDKYRRFNKTVSLINYHFVFCPRYRRKIFRIDGVEDCFKSVVPQICRENQVQILAMECHVDHVHLFLSAPPILSPAEIMYRIKGGSARAIRQTFPNIGSSAGLWSRSYFVSTAGEVSADTIRRYVETQKTRPVSKKELQKKLAREAAARQDART